MSASCHVFRVLAWIVKSFLHIYSYGVAIINLLYLIINKLT